MKYIFLLLCLCGNAYALTPPPIPVVTLTPGAYDSGVTKATACAKYRQAPPVCDDTTSYDSTVLTYYGVTPAATNYTVVRLIPCELGGTDVAANQYPIHNDSLKAKKRLEKKVMDNLCSPVDPITISTARDVVDGDWVTDGYRVYVSTSTPTATNTPIPNTSTPTPTATNTPTNTATNTPTNTATNTAAPSP